MSPTNPRTLALLCLPLLACSSGQKDARKDTGPTDTKAGSTAATRVHFAWPAPGTVTIEETTQKTDAPTTRVRYKLDIKPGSDDQLNMSARDVELLSLGEFDLNDPALAAQLKQAREQLAVRPKFSVTTSGAFVGILEKEALIEAMLGMVAARDGSTPEEMERVRQAFKQPVFAQQLYNIAANPWQAWVGVWVATELPASGSDKAAPATEPAPWTLTNHGSVEGAPGYTKLSYEQKTDLRAQLKKIMRASTPPADGSKLPDVEDAWQTGAMEVEIDLATGRPRWARSKSVKYSKFEGMEPRITEEQSEYRFTW